MRENLKIIESGFCLFYCHCGEVWQNMCSKDVCSAPCPICGSEVEPYDTMEVDVVD